MLDRGDNRIQDYSTKNRRVSGLGSGFGEPQGKDTLTADQILKLLERGELHAEGVRRSVEAQATRR
jgi:hypothetical protein